MLEIGSMTANTQNSATNASIEMLVSKPVGGIALQNGTEIGEFHAEAKKRSGHRLISFSSCNHTRLGRSSDML